MSSSEEGDEGGHWPNCQTNLVLVHHELSLLFCHFINTTAYHFGRYKPSSPSTKELHSFLANPGLFCFPSFLHHNSNLKNQSLDVVLGIQTRDHRMVGADVSTEL